MSNRFGKNRATGCKCEFNYTCGPCLDASVNYRKPSTNVEGLTWSEWYCAAMPSSHVCCTPNALGACPERCPRVNVKAAPAPLVQAWQAGEDPTEWRSELEQAKRIDAPVSIGGVIYRVQPDGSFISERELNITRQRKLAEKDDLTEADKAELRLLAAYFDKVDL